MGGEGRLGPNEGTSLRAVTLTLYLVLAEQGSMGCTRMYACKKWEVIMLGVKGVFPS